MTTNHQKEIDKLIKNLHKTENHKHLKTAHVKALEHLLELTIGYDLRNIHTMVKLDNKTIQIPNAILKSNLPIPFESKLEISLKFNNISDRVHTLSKKISEKLGIILDEELLVNNKVLNIGLDRGDFKKIVNFIEELDNHN